VKPLPPGMARYSVGDCVDGCEFPEWELGEGDEFGELVAGDKVLASCSGCGVTALEAFTDAERQELEVEKAFALHIQYAHLLLFHWTPTRHRRQIIRHGLVPGRRAVTHPAPGWRSPYVCFADTPSYAWSLSAGQRTAPPGEWDLWQTWADRLEEPYVSPADWANGIHEVRTGHRVPKRHLWHVGTRTRPVGERVFR
jgi:hypothetical protein